MLSNIFTATIIISTFNRTHYIAQLLDSLATQSCIEDVEIFIIEAGTDASYLRILDISALIPLNISVIHRPNCTLGDARNYGVSLSKSYWCFFSDDDDVWHSEKIQMIKENYKAFDVISHEYVSSKEPCKSDFSDVISHGNAIYYSFGSIAQNFWGNRYGGGSSLSGRRDFFDSVKFDETMRSCEDIEWIFRAMLSGARMGFIKRPLVCYRIHNQRMTRSIQNNVKWEFFLIKRYFVLSLSLLAGIALKLVRILIRLVFRR